MKTIILPGLIAVCLMLVFASSCNNNKTAAASEVLTFNDSTWLSFLTAMENNDTAYLIQHGAGSIQCADCQLKGGDENGYYKAHYVFEHHIDKLKHVKDLRQLQYSIAESDEGLQVIYSIKAPAAEENAYSLIFLFRRIGGQLLFGGMLVT